MYDENFIHQVGCWILKYGKELMQERGFDMSAPLVNDYFWELVDKSLPDWQREIIESIHKYCEENYNNADSIVNGELRVYFHSITCSQANLGRVRKERFLNTYMHQNEIKLGTVHRDKEDRYLKMDKEYLKQVLGIELIEAIVDLNSPEGDEEIDLDMEF